MKNDGSVEKSERYSQHFKLHKQSRLMQSLKLWLHLWSLRWLKPNRRRINNFNPVGLWIPYVSLHLGLIKFNIFFLTIKYDSDDFMILSKLFHSFTLYGKNEFLTSLSCQYCWYLQKVQLIQSGRGRGGVLTCVCRIFNQ